MLGQAAILLAVAPMKLLPQPAAIRGELPQAAEPIIEVVPEGNKLTLDHLRKATAALHENAIIYGDDKYYAFVHPDLEPELKELGIETVSFKDDGRQDTFIARRWEPYGSNQNRFFDGKVEEVESVEVLHESTRIFDGERWYTSFEAFERANGL